MTSPQLPETAPFSSRHLPPRHELAHAVAFHFLDAITGLALGIGEVGAQHTTVELETEEEVEEIQGLEGEELWAWLAQHGYEVVLLDQAYRQISTSVLVDAANFIYESLVTCAKGKSTVAYSLLRKPLKENLLLLEWLCADPDDLLASFHGQENIGYLVGLPETRRREIIEQAVERAEFALPLPAAVLHELRYEKQSSVGFEPVWQKATHLVTTFEGIQTEPQNLNFVFSTYSSLESHWDHYYRWLPMILAHMLAVAQTVVGEFVEWKEEEHQIQNVLHELALFRSVEEILPNLMGHVDTMLTKFDEWLDLECQQCQATVPIDRPNADRLWGAARVDCYSCGETHDVREYLLDG